ncbi:hypothetical protein BO78DRAFT_51850 [Aspergillus sclerotiicarbonarius CBS 121057]|uniref:Uncharacterized protein n=1 Tax=Aspergillus sclerotiicarbonarius (strain CBS 121057 / IBT 28362) TaxID=1448318 RepID=A0A319EN79_ASPSB|nr:hypothetical protein BO78DRAFT_51850 [Aspergillus sclerotiicarbonarius CBS 121057]
MRVSPGAISSFCSYRLFDASPLIKRSMQSAAFDLFFSFVIISPSRFPFSRRRPTCTDAGLGNRMCLMHEPCLFINSIICAGGDFFASMAGCFGYIGDLTFQGAGNSGAAGTIERCAISVLFVFGFVCSAPLGPTPNLLDINRASMGDGDDRV